MNEMLISRAVKGCHSSRLNVADLSFHRLSRDNSYRAKWFDYTRFNKDYPQNKNLCSQHCELEHLQRDLKVKVNLKISKVRKINQVSVKECVLY